MEIKLRYSIVRFLNEFLAFVLATSIIVFSVSAVLLTCFHSEDFIKKNLQTYSPKTVECVNNKLEELANSTGFPVEAYTSCFDENGADLIYDKIISNINYSYITDFTDDEDIYQYFKTNLVNYCYDNGIDVSSQDISINSSLAVDAVNEVLGGTSTARIGVMRIMKSNFMIALTFIPIILIIASLALIDTLNKGRHRRLNYYGMGLTTAGAVMAFVPAFILLKSYISKYQFCENIIYNSAMIDMVEFALKVIIGIGCLCIAVGFAILISNYHYFGVKEKEHSELREHKLKMRSDYMLEYEENKAKASEMQTEIEDK